MIGLICRVEISYLLLLKISMRVDDDKYNIVHLLLLAHPYPQKTDYIKGKRHTR